MNEVADPLSAVVRRIVRKGGFSHLSVTCADGQTFKAVFRGVDNKDYRFADSNDPTDALMAVLTGRAPKPLKASRAKAAPVKLPVSRQVKARGSTLAGVDQIVQGNAARAREPMTKDDFADLLE